MIRARTILCTLALISPLALTGCGENAAPAPAPSTGSAPSTPPPNPLASNAPARPAASETDATHLIANSIVITIPPSWVKQTPASSMRAAQYGIPAPAGSGLADAELAVFRGIKGSAEENLARWANQITDQTADADAASLSGHNVTIDSVVMFGTYDPGMSMPGSGPQSDWGFAGAIISGDPEGTIHLKLTGPRAVIEAARADWDSMLQSILTNAAPGMR